MRMLFVRGTIALNALQIVSLHVVHISAVTR